MSCVLKPLASASSSSFRGPAPKVVDHYVDAGGSFGSKGFAKGIFGLAEGDDCVDIGGCEGIEVAAGGDDALCSQQPRHLDGKLAGDAGGAQDQDGFSGGQGQRDPSN